VIRVDWRAIDTRFWNWCCCCRRSAGAARPGDTATFGQFGLECNAHTVLSCCDRTVALRQLLSRKAKKPAPRKAQVFKFEEGLFLGVLSRALGSSKLADRGLLALQAVFSEHNRRMLWLARLWLVNNSGFFFVFEAFVACLDGNGETHDSGARMSFLHGFGIHKLNKFQV